MDVNAFTQPDGSTTYQVTAATSAELATLTAAGDGAATWVASNAAIADTVTVTELAAPPTIGAP